MRRATNNEVADWLHLAHHDRVLETIAQARRESRPTCDPARIVLYLQPSLRDLLDGDTLSVMSDVNVYTDADTLESCMKHACVLDLASERLHVKGRR